MATVSLHRFLEEFELPLRNTIHAKKPNEQWRLQQSRSQLADNLVKSPLLEMLYYRPLHKKRTKSLAQRSGR